MARIPMTSGFVIIPEGEYVFRIYDATYDEDFGRIEIKLVNAQGATHTERFSIKDKNDEYNEKALNAFSFGLFHAGYEQRGVYVHSPR